METIAASPYYKKAVELSVRPHKIRLAVAHGLFSSHQIDVGSRLLLRSFDGYPAPGRILDVGCGYGTLGLGLRAKYPESRVDLVDRDALAVEFASANAVADAGSSVEVYGSLAYDQIPASERYDLIVSNIPGKAGLPVVEEFLLGAGRHLQPDGSCAMVVVDPLAEDIEGILRDAKADGIRRFDQRGYSVFEFRPPRPPEPKTTGFERGIYSRRHGEFGFGGLSWSSETAWDLPEFDGLSYGTELAISRLMDSGIRARSALIWGPGQGHLPVAAALAANLELIELADRDLLALRVSQANLARNAGDCEVRVNHTIAPTPGHSELALVALPAKLPPDVLRYLISKASSAVAEGASLVFFGRSTDVIRSVGWDHGLRAGEVRKRRGFAVAHFLKQ